MSSTRKIAAATLAGESFDWSAAGIGAAATAALIVVATGGFAAAHRGSPAKSVG